MYSMVSTPVIWASIGAATDSASVCESAPGYVVWTVTCTGMIDGYCEPGSARIATSPARTMMIETTAAKTGRSMKKRENMRARRRRGSLADGESDVDAPRFLGIGAADEVGRRCQPQTVRLHAGRDQRIAHRLRALLGQRAVLFRRPP